MKKASLGGTVAVACLVSTLTFAGVAHADAQSCTRVGAGAVCNTTKGSGAYVREIWAIRDKPLSTSIMNPSADASVLDGRNNAHVKWFQHKSRTGSDVGRSWFIFYPQRTLPVVISRRCGSTKTMCRRAATRTCGCAERHATGR